MTKCTFFNSEYYLNDLIDIVGVNGRPSTAFTTTFASRYSNVRDLAVFAMTRAVLSLHKSIQSKKKYYIYN
jgi:hypothetical protein